MVTTGAQIRAGRALLGWRQSDLAKAAGLHPKAVAYWEAKTAMRARREEVGVARIRAALEAAGVLTFVDLSPEVCFVAQG